MKIRLIRSATIRLEYAGKKFIIDPYLAAKHAMPSYTGKSPNPLVDLPCKPFQVIEGIDMAIISHLHSDHFDPTAQRLLPQELPILCQPGDESAIKAKGFHRVVPVIDRITWENIEISRTACQHGSGEVLQEMGAASGFVFKNENEPTVYWAGDTIWCKAVENIISQVKPSIIITHSCGAVWGEHVPIVMDAEQTVKVCLAAPTSTIIATHMEALDHTTISRDCLKKYAEAKGIRAEQLLIPSDGETVLF
ncbi:MBL fold metallo-hydrolase [Sporomusa sp.]|uniref:MBL fold metallo-hydrolase n=1 Tax=Sporomusa sp. TaxID=2078658 RepID=UPI002BE5AD34|nr:MBL fold metallo-hydrolase [Sporomusa sp.]HWR44283.1 MBL fold metallo-hydrolase [Sporomusa sp.]